VLKQPLVLLLCVTIVLPGCSSARLMRARTVPAQPAVQSESEALREFVRSIQAGSRIRLETVQGRTLRGTLVQATENEVFVQPNTRLPVPVEKVRIADIARVTLDSPSSNSKLVAIGAAIGAGAAVGVIWIIALIALSGD
jgi:hypothetical protein